jgi:16S rRNA (cytosine967-C5)-methyltransferase
VRAARKLGGNRMAGFANGVLRALARDGEPPLPDRAADPIAYVEAAYSLPRWNGERLQGAVGGDQLDVAAAALAAPAPLAIRVNQLRTSTGELIERLEADHPGIEIERVEGLPEALRLRGLGDPERSPSFGDGLWTVQDVGAQRVGRLAAPRPDQAILDACAGHGGKTTHLAQLAEDRAHIVAVDLSPGKLERAARAAERLGIGSIRWQVADLADPEGALPDGPFDLIVLDAPCSGLGVLRRHPEAKWRVKPELIGQMALLQARILDRLAPLVRRGGALVYAVCTFTREEGAGQIERFLDRHPEFAADGEPLVTWPHTDDADAFFAARLVRRA